MDVFYRDISSSDPGQPKGISAVKILDMASRVGQKRYVLGKMNIAIHNKVLVSVQLDQDAKSEIVNALSTGKTVMLHERPININGWIGSGYVILDSETGSGAYKISGGSNGGVLPLAAGFGLGASATATLYLIGALTPIWSFPMGIALGLMIGVVIATALYNLKVWANSGCFWQGVGSGSAFVGAILAGANINTLLQSLGNLPAAVNLRAQLSEAIAGFVGLVAGGVTSATAPSDPIMKCTDF